MDLAAFGHPISHTKIVIAGAGVLQGVWLERCMWFVWNKRFRRWGRAASLGQGSWGIRDGARCRWSSAKAVWRWARMGEQEKLWFWHDAAPRSSFWASALGLFVSEHPARDRVLSWPCSHIKCEL